MRLTMCRRKAFRVECSEVSILVDFAREASKRVAWRSKDFTLTIASLAEWVKASPSRVANPGSIPAFAVNLFHFQVESHQRLEN